MDNAIEDVVSEVKSVITSEQQRVESAETFDYRAPDSPIFQNKYAAYSFPMNYDTKNPQPFRFGSPYQQLVDVNTLKQLPTIEYNQYNHPEKLQVENLKQGKSDYKVICHITNWAFYRKDDAQFVPEQIDSKLCTHIIYSFATLDPMSLMMKEFDSWADKENSKLLCMFQYCNYLKYQSNFQTFMVELLNPVVPFRYYLGSVDGPIR